VPPLAPLTVYDRSIEQLLSADVDFGVYPELFYCMITQELMTDPVVDPEGNSYERSAIEEWLARNPSSPVTRSPLVTGQLAPNRGLKDAIDRVVEARRAASPPASLPASASVEEVVVAEQQTPATTNLQPSAPLPELL
jgi:hypothetical protein